MPVRIIPARKQAPSPKNAQKAAVKKLRVAAYARVSTDSEDQESSHEAQVAHFTELIESREDWDLAGIYADEGISGTSTEKREDFNRMIADCEARKIDLVITKSISRFARNTLDSLQYIRKLKALDIPILFEKENINTMEYSGELLITIMASIAQQESKSISDNVRLGIQYNFQQGKPMLNHSRFMGYGKDAEGRLCINGEEAAIVRRIFREFLEGMNLCEIAVCLEADGIPSPAGKDKWYQSTVKSMLKNVKYMGDLLLQRTYTIDFLSKKRAKNLGECPQYYVKNAHPPIIPREIFMIVQGQLLNKEKERILSGRKAVPSKALALNGRVFCSVCGSSYRRDQSSRRRTYWRCKARLQNCKNCAGTPVLEAELHQAVVSACNELPSRRDALENIRDREIPEKLRQIERALARANQEKDYLEELLSEKAKASGLLKRQLPGAGIAGLSPNANFMTGNAARESSSVTSSETGAGQGDSSQARAGIPAKAAPGSMHLAERGEETDFDEYEVQTRLDELQEKCSGLLSQKAMLIMQKSNIARVLQFIDSFAGAAKDKDTAEADAKKSPQEKPLPRPDTLRLPGEASCETISGSSACYTLEDFYEKTEYPLPNGPLENYGDELVRLFITRIDVFPTSLQIRFKAGIDIRWEGSRE